MLKSTFVSEELLKRATFCLAQLGIASPSDNDEKIFALNNDK